MDAMEVADGGFQSNQSFTKKVFGDGGKWKEESKFMLRLVGSHAFDW